MIGFVLNLLLALTIFTPTGQTVTGSLGGNILTLSSAPTFGVGANLTVAGSSQVYTVTLILGNLVTVSPAIDTSLIGNVLNLGTNQINPPTVFVGSS